MRGRRERRCNDIQSLNGDGLVEVDGHLASLSVDLGDLPVGVGEEVVHLPVGTLLSVGAEHHGHVGAVRELRAVVSEQRSRGLGVDGAGNVLPGLLLSLGQSAGVGNDELGEDKDGLVSGGGAQVVEDLLAVGVGEAVDDVLHEEDGDVTLGLRLEEGVSLEGDTVLLNSLGVPLLPELRKE